MTAMSNTRNRLVALVFDDPYKADEARAELRRASGEGLLEIGETALIEKRADGKVRVSQDTDTVEKDQKIGHIAGLVTAALTGTLPFILGGTIAGKLIGKLHDNGITNAFLKSIDDELRPGTSALVLYGRSNPGQRPELLKRVATFNPKILESDLPADLEQALNESLEKAERAIGVR
jgi:uncharacterized membrane protein